MEGSKGFKHVFFSFLGPYVEDKNDDSSMSMYGQDEE
jgi:hypothetical protein